MTKLTKKTKRIIIITFASLFLIIALIIAFISPLTKYLIEKYDEKFTGRQITMDWAYVNPFTGHLYFNNLNIHEFKSDSSFFNSDGLSVDFSLRKMLFGTYEIQKLTLDNPKGIVIQNKKGFNFVDLIEKFSPENADTTISGVRFSIRGIKIINGEFHYREELIPVNYFIKDVYFESPGKKWDVDTIVGKFSFSSGLGSGTVKGDFNFNTKNHDYKYNVKFHKFDLNIIGQFLKDLSNYGTFAASMEADLKAKGNLDNQQDVTIKGALEINDFHLGKNQNEYYMSFNKFAMSINELSPLKHIYNFDSVSLKQPYFKYEQYDKSDNLETMFGKGGSNISNVAGDNSKFNLVIEIARYVKVMAHNFFQSAYKINRLAIYDGDLKFNDYSLSNKFSTDLSPINFIADSIDEQRRNVEAVFTSGIEPYGNMKVNLTISPKDTGDFDLNYHINKIPIAMFNPYLVSYTSFPLDRGKLELNGTWKVRKGEIESSNHLLVIDPRVTKKVKNKNNSWIPLPLIFSFVREYGNVIDYEIPITGNLKDPKFHLKDVVFDVLGNIFIKPVLTPYRMEVKSVENEIEKSLNLKWATQQIELRKEQKSFIEKLVDFLKDNPEASIIVSPNIYAEKEKENILLFEAKKKFLISQKQKGDKSFNESDSITTSKMSIKDSTFLRYLNKFVPNTLIFTVQEKCSIFIGETVVNQKFKEMNEVREKVFRSYFDKPEIKDRITFNKSDSTIPYNGFSVYKISYKGKIPNALAKAYEKIQELNDEAPRLKYERAKPKVPQLPAATKE